MRQAIWTLLIILSTYILTGCGQINLSSFRKDFCSQETHKINELNLEIDMIIETSRENNDDWQKAYDDKPCMCDYQDRYLTSDSFDN